MRLRLFYFDNILSLNVKEVVTPEESADRNSHIPRLLNYIVNIDPQHKRIRILVTGCGGDEESL